MTSNSTILEATEYEPFNHPDKIFQNINDDYEARPSDGQTNREVASRLGLHNYSIPTAGDYVGLVWCPGKAGEIALRVTPKFEQMDYLQMYLECLQDKVLASHMDKCFFFWPEKKLIEIKKKDIPLGEAAAPFAALAFVRELHDMVKRNMRKNFIRKEENLTGRFKGRLLMSQHVRKNLLNGRPDRNYCQFGVISEDCRENQILLTALDRAARKLFADSRVTENTTIQQQIRTCRSALQGVTLRRRIHNRDFAGIRYTGTFVHYKRPHALAKLILNSQELDPSVKADQDDNELVKVVPFALCTSELFERYCEVKLRENESLKVWAGNEDLGADHFRYRPDFLCAEQKSNSVKYWILDSKYYRSYQSSPRDITENNVQQLLKYSQHEGVRDKLLSLERNGTETPPSLAILYPEVENHSGSCDLKYSKAYNDFILELGLIPLYVPKLK